MKVPFIFQKEKAAARKLDNFKLPSEKRSGIGKEEMLLLLVY